MIGWWFVAISGIACAAILTALYFAVQADRKAWAAKMEEIERRHTARLCAWGARRARTQMRIRALIRRIDDALGR